MLSWHIPHENPLWIYPKDDPKWKESIIKEFKIHPVTAQILVSRGFTSFDQIHDYLYSKLPDLCDPFLMAEMSQAVDRICQALNNKENVLIYGDNDVDGMTGTALLTEFLQFIGINVFFYVSTRGTNRQSLIVEALEYAIKNECKLLITVDCGITAAAEIAKVIEQNIDVIVTDHHEPTDKIPHCVATLNPKLINNTYPNRDLTGVGVAFKLAHAVTLQLIADGKISPKKIDLKRYLDLVALGTVSDMGILLGENRILVSYGLKLFRNKLKRVGLAKLIGISGVDIDKEITTFDIASKIAPRLNSLGRIDDPKKGVQMLLARNAQTAEKMAIELDLNNIERQKIERTMSVDIENTIVLHPEILKNKAIIMTSDRWHPGVIAILATRIAKHYNRPTVMMALDKDVGKASLRSIPEFPLLNVLKDCSDILVNFGGHDFAAGLTIKIQHIEEFKQRFLKAANEKLQDQDVLTKLYLDAELPFDDLTIDLMESLKLFEPFGNENQQPIFYCDVKQAWPPKVVGKALKLYLVPLVSQSSQERMFEAIALYRAPEAPALRKKDLKLRVAFTPQFNHFQGPSIQLIVRDYQVLN